MYDFHHDCLSICDIDLFEKQPWTNQMGEDYFGTKRLKAPEENQIGAEITEQTSLYTLGAIICDLLSEINNKKQRYEKGVFIINDRNDYCFNDKSYEVLKKATDYTKENRYATVKEFHEEWKKCL